jgi:hypothetical protein
VSLSGSQSGGGLWLSDNWLQFSGGFLIPISSFLAIGLIAIEMLLRNE